MNFSVPHPVIFLVSAPSGAGKTTLCQRLMSLHPELEFSVSSTTRNPREGEVHGVDYDFLDRGQFDRLVEQGEFIEHAEVHGNGYGTRKSAVVDRFRNGKSVLLDIDVQGAGLMRDYLATLSEEDPVRRCYADVFICPPSLDTLRERLEGRGKDTPETIDRRLKNAEEEMQLSSGYQYRIVNDDLETAFHHLRSIYTASTLLTTAAY